MLSPAEIIPPYFGEFKTDVIVMSRGSERSCADHNMYKTIIGGIRIQSNIEKWLVGLEGAVPEAELPQVADENGGTLGYFGTINGNNTKNNIVLLTNEHVLARNGGREGTPVFNPKITNSYQEIKKK